MGGRPTQGKAEIGTLLSRGRRLELETVGGGLEERERNDRENGINCTPSGTCWSQSTIRNDCRLDPNKMNKKSENKKKDSR